MISCIIPCYRSEDSIAEVVQELTMTFAQRNVDDFEIVLVNDSSPDHVWDVIKNLCAEDNRVKGLDLARNFGQHNAIMAGLNHAQGNVCVFMDDDGQTPGNEVWKLIDALDDNCDVVFAKYENKKHSPFRNIGSGINSLMARILISKPKHLYLSSYIACKRYVADELLRYNGDNTYLSGLLIRATNRVTNVVVEHRERRSGESGYSVGKLFALWLSGFTAFSVKPLRVASLLGIFLAVAGFVYGLYVAVRKLIINPSTPAGWSSTMAVLLFIGGVIMVILGIIGEYLGRSYIRLNNSPQFVIRDKSGF